jgi:hypothetical protein
MLARELAGVAASPGLGSEAVEELDFVAVFDLHVTEAAAAYEAARVAVAQDPRSEAVSLPVRVEVAEQRLGCSGVAHAAERRHHARIGVQRDDIGKVARARAREEQAFGAKALQLEFCRAFALAIRSRSGSRPSLGSASLRVGRLVSASLLAHFRWSSQRETRADVHSKPRPKPV